MEDIQSVVIENIDDIDTIINYCSQSKSILKKCLTRQFWNPIFKKQGLELPDGKIKSLEYIYEEYKKLKSKKLTHDFMNGDMLVLQPYKDENIIELLNDCKIKNNLKNKNIESIDFDFENNFIILLITDYDVYYTEMLDASKEQMELFIFNLFYNNMVYVSNLE